MTKLTLKNHPNIKLPQETEQIRKQQCIEFLCKTFPECFSKASPKPLKTGILEDITEKLKDEMPFSKATLRKTLQDYCQNFNYLRKILEITYRIGLDGQETETVTKEHLDYTKKKLQQMKKSTVKQPFKK